MANCLLPGGAVGPTFSSSCCHDTPMGWTVPSNYDLDKPALSCTVKVVYHSNRKELKHLPPFSFLSPSLSSFLTLLAPLPFLLLLFPLFSPLPPPFLPYLPTLVVKCSLVVKCYERSS